MKTNDLGCKITEVAGNRYYVRRQGNGFKMGGIQVLERTPLGKLRVLKHIVDTRPTAKKTEGGKRTVPQRFKSHLDAYRFLTYYIPV
jgi:hypothetical protein